MRGGSKLSRPRLYIMVHRVSGHFSSVHSTTFNPRKKTTNVHNIIFFILRRYIFINKNITSMYIFCIFMSIMFDSDEIISLKVRQCVWDDLWSSMKDAEEVAVSYRILSYMLREYFIRQRTYITREVFSNSSRELSAYANKSMNH